MRYLKSANRAASTITPRGVLRGCERLTVKTPFGMAAVGGPGLMTYDIDGPESITLSRRGKIFLPPLE